jgi:hypothetical protein
LNLKLRQDLRLGTADGTHFPEEQISWEDLLARMPLDSAIESSEPLPSGGDPLPMLELTTTAPREGLLRKTGLPRCRLRVWFDPQHDYCPVRFESDILEKNEADATHQYIHWDVIEWSDFRRLPDGIVQPFHCAIHWHTFFGLPRNTGSDDRFPAISYNTKTTDCVLSDVRINEPLDGALFELAPPRGTHVRDELAGFAYIVGSAGEELEKRALQERERSQLGRPRAWSSWQWALTVLTSVFVVVALGYGVWRVSAHYRAKRK